MSFDHLRLWALGTVVCLGTLHACSDPGCPTKDLEKRQIPFRDISLTVEIASTAAERACGLSLRESLDVNHGMLFVYPDDRIREFWMKDTHIPLTIAFLDADGQITTLYDMDPSEPERRYRSRQAVRYALETHRGWFRENNIVAGYRVDLGL